jgi:hypothetical protein
VSTQYRVTFVVTRGQEPVVWDEVFASGVLSAQKIGLAQAEANGLLSKAIRRPQESLEGPEIHEADIVECRAIVEPLSAWVKRGVRTLHEIRGWTPEETENA